MTKKERGQYAALCSHLQAEARKNGTQYTKPERPDAHTLDSVCNAFNKYSVEGIESIYCDKRIHERMIV